MSAADLTIWENSLTRSWADCMTERPNLANKRTLAKSNSEAITTRTPTAFNLTEFEVIFNLFREMQGLVITWNSTFNPRYARNCQALFDYMRSHPLVTLN